MKRSTVNYWFGLASGGIIATISHSLNIGYCLLVGAGIGFICGVVDIFLFGDE